MITYPGVDDEAGGGRDGSSVGGDIPDCCLAARTRTEML
jgi:hypothetical protein